MAIQTRSAFTYGHKIDTSNENINFVEDGINELTATIETGSYYLNQFIDKIAQALNEIGDNAYTVTLDRNTRLITISADANFDLLVTTGTQLETSAFSLMGFTTDRSGSNSYTADTASGLIYYPQAPLYDYVPFENIREAVQSKRNESSSGENVEVISYGLVNYMECNIKYATDITGQGYIENNANGVSDLRTFMEYITRINPIEFIPDKSDLDTFTPCILESTRQSRDGTAFELRELYSEKLANYYESSTLRFRRIS